eukprot:GHVN01014359.1.p1 GENE.GHVN01014359.1~~GHVN01014359.1.p1  ORF type:complete len:1010 (+),score=236.31 GHVN01014359.1:54-3083(+)
MTDHTPSPSDLPICHPVESIPPIKRLMWLIEQSLLSPECEVPSYASCILLLEAYDPLMPLDEGAGHLTALLTYVAMVKVGDHYNAFNSPLCFQFIEDLVVDQKLSSPCSILDDTTLTCLVKERCSSVLKTSLRLTQEVSEVDGGHVSPTHLSGYPIDIPWSIEFLLSPIAALATAVLFLGIYQQCSALGPPLDTLSPSQKEIADTQAEGDERLPQSPHSPGGDGVERQYQVDTHHTSSVTDAHVDDVNQMRGVTTHLTQPHERRREESELVNQVEFWRTGCVLGPPGDSAVSHITTASTTSTSLTPTTSLTSTTSPTPTTLLILSVMEAMSVDGELLYEGVVAVSYLRVAVTLLDHLTQLNSHTSVSKVSKVSEDGEAEKQAEVSSTWGDDERVRWVTGVGLLGLSSLFVWRGRAAFVWQRAVSGGSSSPCPSLAAMCVEQYAAGLKAIGLIPASFSCRHQAPCGEDVRRGIGGAGCDKEVNERREHIPIKALVDVRLQPALVLELAMRLAYYDLTAAFQEASNVACDLACFKFELTGVLGTRRSHQTRQLPQLVVKTNLTSLNSVMTHEKVSKVPREDGSGTSQGEGSVPAQVKEVPAQVSKVPAQVGIEYFDPNTDVLERVRLQTKDDSKSVEGCLSVMHQCLLLTHCTSLIASQSLHDPLAMEELNAMVQRCLVLPSSASETQSNWLVFSSGLWFRCKSEANRSKTVERACLQLQSLVDQYSDHEPAVDERIGYAYCVDYPTRWEAMKELGSRMLKIGAVSSAFEMFKGLSMWEEAIECLIAASRKSEAIELVIERLSIHPTPSLWCSYGDVDNNLQHYEKAWEISGHRFARAQRSLGHRYFKACRYKEASCSYELAVEINPMHINAWFALGTCYMRMGDWAQSVRSFGRVVSMDGEQGEAWANMSAAHSQAGSWREARYCIGEAVKRSRENWKMWDSQLRVCVKVRDMSGVFLSANEMMKLRATSAFPHWVMEFITDMVVNDLDTSLVGIKGGEVSAFRGRISIS